MAFHVAAPELFAEFCRSHVSRWLIASSPVSSSATSEDEIAGMRYGRIRAAFRSLPSNWILLWSSRGIPKLAVVRLTIRLALCP